MDEHKERIEKLEKQIEKLKSIAWVVVIVAGIFGISGGWGITAILSVKQNIDELKQEVAALQVNATTVNELYTKLRESQEAIFDSHVEGKRQELDSHISTVTADVNAQKHIISSIQNDISSIRDSYVKIGGKIRLRNEAYGRCIDLRSQNRNVIQLVECKGLEYREQTWTVDKR
ncbi:hypothetical protein J7384_08725 [Endozoicomonas sp. G2_1]|uniref:hypothetical protein n=1 Tax=Endozoicomonas sp. G2_1 TaxID=2821091 RepID=UPI001ADC8EBC|nr:hypothetical protein [Endozoicomonas sp. G2_1]MBO9490444.1 hypothetical protein [Endozoicomonas sp. G2_1]